MLSTRIELAERWFRGYMIYPQALRRVGYKGNGNWKVVTPSASVEGVTVTSSTSSIWDTPEEALSAFLEGVEAGSEIVLGYPEVDILVTFQGKEARTAADRSELLKTLKELRGIYYH